VNKRLLSASSLSAAQANERGFSMTKTLFWLMLVGFALWYGALVGQAHYTNWKVQDLFDSLPEKMGDASEAAIRARLPKLFNVMYLSPSDLPPEFQDNLVIRREGSMLEVSSSYTVVIWPLGPVQAVDEEGSYDPEQLEGMDIVRDKLRTDIEFAPYAISK